MSHCKYKRRREVGHRVKSISTSKFSGPEITSLEHGGNGVARMIWLSNYNINTVEPESDGDVRLFMRQKYYEQKWLDREKGVAHAEQVKRLITELYTEDGNPRSPNSRITKRQSLHGTADRPKMVPTQSWVDDNVPIGLISTVKTTDLLLNDDSKISPMSPTIPSPLQPSNSSSRIEISAPQQPEPKQTSVTVESVKNDFFTELAVLNPAKPVKMATYTGGILQPNSPSSATALNHDKINTFTSINITSQQISAPTSPTQLNMNSNVRSIDTDPYAALRDLSIGSKPVTPPPIVKMESSDSLSFGDFQKSPTVETNTAKLFSSKSNNALFGDLDPIFKR
ncbi:hypothetical protein [Parasitella parasitica]|uniref:Arf-GAP domain-containing protein n=1 Tax=Parasitella parasitica TaxID=35722 RepID=A0A0B7NBP1_9FUNG|nr:hypothetical protein [Parasitella parasitica]